MLTTIRTLSAIASTATPRRLISHWFSETDAKALAWAVQEIERLRGENDRLKADLMVAAERVAICSELLGRKAEKRK